MRPLIRYTLLAVICATVTPTSAFEFSRLSWPRASTADTPLLPVEQAYRCQASVAAPDRIRLDCDIAPATFLYRDTLRVTLPADAPVQVGAVTLPPAEIKPDTVRPDGSSGDVAIYHGHIAVDVALQRLAPAALAATDIVLTVKYQGCAERGVCYPPVTTPLPLTLPAMPAPLINTAPPAVVTPLPINATAPPAAAQERIAAQLATTSLPAAFALFIGFGLLLALTPCIFPMIPMLSGIIAGQGDNVTPRQAFYLSLSYVTAMALTYAIAGVIAGLFGANIQIALQTPWVITAFAALFIALALSMFGLYELQLPSSVLTKLTRWSNAQTTGTLIGAAVMGVLAALIVGPCIAPPLLGALMFIGQTGNVSLGFVALFGLGVGMGIPLLIIGTSLGQLLPRAGAWMDSVKTVFGVVLLGVAIYLLERIAPPPVTLFLWSALAIVSSVYWGAVTPLPSTATGWQRIQRGGAVVLFIYGSVLLIGAAAGGHDPLQPLRGVFTAPAALTNENNRVTFQPINSGAELERALTTARQLGRPALLDVTADWCVACREWEQAIFPAPAVQAALARFVLLRADITAQTAEQQALMRQLEIFGPPLIVLFDAAGREQQRIAGVMSAAEFVTHLQEMTP